MTRKKQTYIITNLSCLCGRGSKCEVLLPPPFAVLAADFLSIHLGPVLPSHGARNSAKSLGASRWHLWMMKSAQEALQELGWQMMPLARWGEKLYAVPMEAAANLKGRNAMSLICDPICVIDVLWFWYFWSTLPPQFIANNVESCLETMCATARAKKSHDSLAKFKSHAKYGTPKVCAKSEKASNSPNIFRYSCAHYKSAAPNLSEEQLLELAGKSLFLDLSFTRLWLQPCLGPNDSN